MALEINSTGSSQILSILDLHVSFRIHGGSADVVDGVDLAVRTGETVTIVGETGCGKSLTVKAILGLLPESSRVSGHVYFNGKDLFELDERELWELRSKEISLVPQDPMSSLNPVFTIGEQMKDMIEFRGKNISIPKSLLPFGRKKAPPGLLR